MTERTINTGLLHENGTSRIDALEPACASSIALSGFLLESGLTARASTAMDLPARGWGAYLDGWIRVYN